MAAGKQLSDGNPSGTGLGQSASDLVGLHGVDPTAMRTSAKLSSTLSVFALTGASFVANTSSTVSGLFGFNSTFMSQIIDAIQEIRALVVAKGLHSGGA